jgi:hypothetical protein
MASYFIKQRYVFKFYILKEEGKEGNAIKDGKINF